MASVVHLSNTDQRITYSPHWEMKTVIAENFNFTYSLTSTVSAELFFLFRGIVHT